MCDIIFYIFYGKWVFPMKMVSKKDLIFISLIFVAVIVFSLVTGGNTVEVDFQNDSMSINATGFAFNILYADVEKIELTNLPDFGIMDKGTDTAALKCGNWSNGEYGEYHLCVIPEVDQCIEVTLKDGRVVVFNYKEAKNTQDVYSVFQENLGQ